MFILILVSVSFDIQSIAEQSDSDPKGVFVRSMIVPGWGHFYNDRNEWNRGKIHLSTEIAFIAAILGFQNRSSTLKADYTTLANLRSGVNIDGRNRSFQISLAEFPSLRAYNDFQLRKRNWNRLIEDNHANNWQWYSEEDRLAYGELRSKRDRIRSQIPAFFGLMIVNRVVSTVSAYNRASQSHQDIQISLLPILCTTEQVGRLQKLFTGFR